MKCNRTVHPSFDCSQPCCSPFRCSWWLGRTRTRLQLGNRAFCVTGPVAWNIVSHCTFVLHLHYQRSKTCSRHICSLVPISLTNCFQSTSSEHCRRPCSDSSHVTAPYKLSFYYYYLLLLLLFTWRQKPRPVCIIFLAASMPFSRSGLMMGCDVSMRRARSPTRIVNKHSLAGHRTMHVALMPYQRCRPTNCRTALSLK